MHHSKKYSDIYSVPANEIVKKYFMSEFELKVKNIIHGNDCLHAISDLTQNTIIYSWAFLHFKPLEGNFFKIKVFVSFS
jgi:hypothetical protein